MNGLSDNVQAPAEQASLSTGDMPAKPHSLLGASARNSLIRGLSPSGSKA